MPITISAKKKLRQDAKRHSYNLAAKVAVSNAVKKFKKSKSEKLLSEAFSAIDLALKKNIIHKNKAARMKSSLAKMIGSKTKQGTVPVRGQSPTAAKAVKAPAKKKVSSKPAKTSKKK